VIYQAGKIESIIADVGETEAMSTQEVVPLEGQPVGFDAQGSLLVQSPKDQAIRALKPDRSVQNRTWPDDKPAHQSDGGTAKAKPLDRTCAFNHNGRGLCIEKSTGRTWQSIDGAKTWTPTAGPGRPIDDRAVYCTTNRCEVQELFVRHGWDEPGTQQPQREVKPSKLKPATQATVPTASKQPHIECQPEPKANPQLPAGSKLAWPNGLRASVGFADALWAAVSFTVLEPPKPNYFELYPIKKRKLSLLIGTADGRVREHVLGRFKGNAASDQATVLAGSQSLWANWITPKEAKSLGSDGGQVAPVKAVLLTNKADARPHRLRGPFDRIAWDRGSVTSCLGLSWATNQGIARFERCSNSVLWTDDRGKTTRRNIGVAGEIWQPRPPLAVGPNDSWITVLPYSGAILQDPHESWPAFVSPTDSLELISVGPDNVENRRHYAVAPNHRVVGAGLAVGAGKVDVGLIEIDDTTEPKLQVYRLAKDLELVGPLGASAGAKTSLPLLELPSCGTKVPSGVFEVLHKEVTVRWPVGTSKAKLVQRIRFDSSQACVARSMLEGDYHSKTAKPWQRIIARGNFSEVAVVAYWSLEPDKTVAWEAVRCRIVR